jgi:hypothetical protein
MRKGIGLLVVSVALVAHGVAWAGETPVAVSPGDASKLVLIGDTCPTFSWGGIPEAWSYELVGPALIQGPKGGL